MFARKGVFSSIGRAATLATVAAVALTAVEPTMALAGSANGKPVSVTSSQGTSGATDFSSRRRYYRGGGAAAAAAFAGIVGTGLAIAAAQNRYYDSYGYYGGGPVYYDPGPTYYYGGPGYYGYNRANSYGYGGYGYNGHQNYYNGW